MSAISAGFEVTKGFSVFALLPAAGVAVVSPVDLAASLRSASDVR